MMMVSRERPGSEPGRPWWRLRRVRAVLILIVLLTLVRFVLVPRLSGSAETMRLIGRVPLPFLVTAIVLETASLAAYSMLSRTVLPKENRPSLGVLMRIDLTTLGVNHAIPGGAAVAAALRYRLLTTFGVRGSDAVFGAVSQGASSAIVLNGTVWIALLVAIPVYGARPLFGLVIAVGAALLSTVAVAVLALTRGHAWTIDLVRKIASYVPRVTPDQAEFHVGRVAQDLRAFTADHRLLARAAGWSAVNWLLDAASLWVFLAAFGYRIEPVGLLMSFGVANVLAALPITPGGLGIVEGVLVPMLVVVGAPHEAALLAVLTWRLVNFWLPLPIAGVTYLSLRSRLAAAADLSGPAARVALPTPGSGPARAAA
jgi:uncharacterized protein (TIRG00374 family)